MKPLITIETVPISIEYVEKQTAHKSAQSASLRISTQDRHTTIQSNPIHIHMDTFESCSPVDWQHNLSYTATAQYSSDGNLSLNVQVGKDDTSKFNYDQVGRDMNNMINYVPKSFHNAMYGIENMQINFNMSQLSEGLPNAGAMDTSFLPPDLELKVVEYPKVIIKYIGGPIYFPKSADPNYVPEEEVNQIFDGKPSTIDVKI